MKFFFAASLVGLLASSLAQQDAGDWGNVFPRVLTVKTTQNGASHLSRRLEIDHAHSRRLLDEGPEAVELSVIVFNEAELEFLKQTKGATMEVHEELSRRHLEEWEGIQGGWEFSGRDLTCYRTTDEMLTSLDMLVAKYPDFVTVSNIGQSWLGEDIKMVVLTSPVDGYKADVAMSAGLHSRELPPPEMTLRWVEMALEEYGTDPDITMILDRVRLHLAPVVNPDGRRIVEEHLDWWKRKNVHKVGCEDQVADGVDLNRNFPMFWGWPGASSDVCDNTYMGEGPMSEPETEALYTYVQDLFPDEIKRGRTHDEAIVHWEEACPEDAAGIFMDVHSWGDYIIFPWLLEGGPTTPNHLSLLSLAAKMAYPGNYTLWGPEQDGFLYHASGGSSDATYGMDCIPSFDFELGLDGFYANCTIFEETIEPQFYGALKVALMSASAAYKLPKGPDITSIDVDVANNIASLTVEVTDDGTTVSYARFPDNDRSQAVTGVMVYVDVHPDDAGAAGVAMNPADGAFDTHTETATVVLDMAGWDVGRHVLYFQGMDADGNAGPVSAAWVTAVGSCADGSVFAHLVLETDGYAASENGLVFGDRDCDHRDCDTHVWSADVGDLENHSRYTYDACVDMDPTQQCYRFAYFDHYGDGFLWEGGLTLFWDGEIALQINPGDDGDTILGAATWMAKFGYCPAMCGDGIVEDGEECDDGNDIDDDGCTNSCTAPACGDGVWQWPLEGCDDGNTVSGDGCSSDCIDEGSCGAGLAYASLLLETDVWSNVESSYLLRDTAAADGDYIWAVGLGELESNARYGESACLDPTQCYEFVYMDDYGDGMESGGVRLYWDAEMALRLNAGELYFERSTTFGSCGDAPVCGNGIVEDGEECDDGNSTDDDECGNDCMRPVISTSSRSGSRD